MIQKGRRKGGKEGGRSYSNIICPEPGDIEAVLSSRVRGAENQGQRSSIASLCELGELCCITKPQFAYLSNGIKVDIVDPDPSAPNVCSPLENLKAVWLHDPPGVGIQRPLMGSA